ncbi:MAG: lytic transglycosylase domain-containing protein [bacterium]
MTGTRMLLKCLRVRETGGIAVKALIAGIAISLAVLVLKYNITPAIADETVTAPVVLQEPVETPVSTESAQDKISLARIMLFEKRIASKGVSEAERREIAEHIVRYSRILGIQPELGAALIAKESRFNPRSSSRSHKGLGQLGATAARNNGVKDPFDIEQNVRGTLSYLKQMMDIWKGRPDRIERALASFNSGAGAVRSRGPGISRTFVKSVLKYHSDMFKSDISLLFSEDTFGHPAKQTAE